MSHDTTQQIALLLIILDVFSLLAYALRRSQDRDLARSVDDATAEEQLRAGLEDCVICMGPCELAEEINDSDLVYDLP